MNILLLSLLVLFSLGLINESEAYKNYTLPPPESLLVELDNTSYVIGEMITISGTVEKHYQNTMVQIILYSPDNRIISILKADVDSDKDFTLHIDTSDFKKTGEHYIKSSYGPNSEIIQTTFEISPYDESVLQSKTNTIPISSDSENHSDMESMSKEIPNWIKNNVQWWADGLIEDQELIQGIEFLINEQVLIVPPTTVSEEKSNKIPTWIKNNGKWWTEGIISDSEFLNNIQFLISNGILSVNSELIMEPIQEPCTSTEMPVCGVDGKIYGNMCKLQEANIKLDSSDSCIISESEPTIISGNFNDADFIHRASGIASVEFIPEQGGTLTFDQSFDTTNGPDLYVYLSSDETAKDFVNLGRLQSFNGEQSYPLSSDLNLEKYHNVLIWCQAFGVLFGNAELN